MEIHHNTKVLEKHTLEITVHNFDFNYAKTIEIISNKMLEKIKSIIDNNCYNTNHYLQIDNTITVFKIISDKE